MNSFLLHYILYILISKCSFLQICNCNFLFSLRPHTSIDTGLLFIYFFPKHLRAGFYVFILKMRRKSIEPGHSYETGMVKLVWINLRLSAGGSGNDSLKPKVTLRKIKLYSLSCYFSQACDMVILSGWYTDQD